MPSSLRRVLSLVILGLAAVSAGCRQEAAAGSGQQRPDDAREVQVVPVSEVSLPRTAAVTGTLAAEEQADVGFKVAGRVKELPVDLGSRVGRGDVLARLVTTDFELRVRQAEAALQQARARLGLSSAGEDDTVDAERTSVVQQARAVLDEARMARERARRLHTEQLIAQADLDAAESSFLVAEARYQDAVEEAYNRQGLLAQRRAELDLARQQLSDAVLRAPFEGAVRERQAAIGQYVSPGQTVMTLVRMHPLRLRLAVPERISAGVREGLAVRLTVEGTPGEREGIVARLSPAVDEGSRTLMVEATVPNEDGSLRPGSFARADVVIESSQDSLVVPQSALLTFAGIEKVIVVEDGRSVERRVRTGRRLEGKVEILDGLRAGESVVVEPGNLVGGQAVRVVG
ncbi:MAG: efflux RND transporter periplasmic adaptor subunit [Candidatus Polarisedimenticolia bacterium]